MPPISPYSLYLTRETDLLLRLYRQLRRIRMQSSYIKFYSSQPHGIFGRHCYKMFSCPPEGYQERTLLRKEGHIFPTNIPRPDHDSQRCCKHECLPTRGRGWESRRSDIAFQCNQLTKYSLLLSTGIQSIETTKLYRSKKCQSGHRRVNFREEWM